MLKDKLRKALVILTCAGALGMMSLVAGCGRDEPEPPAEPTAPQPEQPADPIDIDELL